MTARPVPPQILTGPRCGWPDRARRSTDQRARPRNRDAPDPWTYHDMQCQVPNPQPGPQLDGYPECGQIDGHAGDHDYVRHAAEGFLPAAAAEAGEAEIG